MKIIVNRILLGEAANLLARVINPKNVMPILGDVLFDVKDNEVTLTASDTEVTLSTTIRLDTMEGDGQFCVSAKDLSTALAEITDEKKELMREQLRVMREYLGILGKRCELEGIVL